MLVDIHNHGDYFDNQSIISIFNLTIGNCKEDRNFSALLHFSVGVHPWDVTSTYSFDFQSFLNIFSNKQIIAVGESGLDRTRKETFEQQREIFFKMIEASEKLHKPLIIHAVRTYPDIISIRKETKAKMPWIVHGFNGSTESAMQLINHGMYISFGEILYRNENQAVRVLNSIPLNKVFFETDVSKRNISDVYEKAASLLNCEKDFLERVVFNNFKTIFGDGKLEEQNTYINR